MLSLFLLSLDNVGLKFKYQFNDHVVESTSKKAQLDNNNCENMIESPTAKKTKLNHDNKKTSILEYSSVQLPVTAFIEYLEKQHLNVFVEQCLSFKNSIAQD